MRNKNSANCIADIHIRLGITEHYADLRQLLLHSECSDLVSIGEDVFQRPQRMLPEAARAWHTMRESALNDGVELQVVSAFRSIEYQVGIIERKLAAGQCIDDILKVSAAPGYSEHHSGRALDLTTPGFKPLEEEFEDSEAFSWLGDSASQFQFNMSYPKDNCHGVAYEPWHWCWNR